MKYLKELVIIFGITMAGELLNRLIPLPVPAGVYGLFLVPFLVITFLSTLIVMTVTGKTTEFILHFQRREDR